MKRQNSYGAHLEALPARGGALFSLTTLSTSCTVQTSACCNLLDVTIDRRRTVA